MQKILWINCSVFYIILYYFILFYKSFVFLLQLVEMYIWWMNVQYMKLGVVYSSNIVFWLVNFCQISALQFCSQRCLHFWKDRYRGVDVGDCHYCQCNTPKWLTWISRVEFLFLKVLWTRFSNLTESRCGRHCSERDADIARRIQFFLSRF